MPGGIVGDGTSQDLHDDDDWTTVSDRRLKKKIQNRVAQRSYRSRVKQRLESLQQQVNSLDKSTISPKTPSSSGGSGDVTRVPVDTTTTRPTERRPQPGKSFHDARSMEVQHPHLLPTFSNQPRNDYHQGAYFTAVRDLQQLTESWPLSEQSKCTWLPEDLQLASPWASGVTLSQDPGNNTCWSGIPSQTSAQGNNWPHVPNGNLNHAHSGDRSLDFVSLGLPNYRKTTEDCVNSPSNEVDVHIGLRQTRPSEHRGVSCNEPLSHKSQQLSDRAKASEAHLPSDKPAAIRPGFDETHIESVGDMTEGSRWPPRSEETHKKPSKDAALRERMRYVLECAVRVGFDSIDALVSSYNALELDDAPGASGNECPGSQDRLTRHMASTHDSSMDWATRKLQGREDGILKTAENILSAECNSFSQSGILNEELIQLNNLEPLSGSFGPAKDLAGGRAKFKPTNTAIRNALEDELPNLWALVTVLIANNLALRQRDRSRVVLVALVMLCCSGRVGMSQLGTWVYRFLNS